MESDTFPARVLERWLGKPSALWTVEDLVVLVRERGIRLVSLMHVGADGALKTLDFVPRSLAHLRDVLEGGERADGSSLFAGLGIRAGASDILLRPRAGSAFLDPFSPLPTLAILCAHAGRDGAPLPQSPDTLVVRAWERYREEVGAELWALGEVEYFLGRPARTEDQGHDERGYHASAPQVFGEKLRRKALVTLAELGVPIKYGHAEVGYIAATGGDDLAWEQHEIELALAPLPLAAEGVLLTQWVLRQLAHDAGLRCSFEPIVRRGHAGSGLHFHLSSVREGQHQPVRLPSGPLHPDAQGLIAGLVRHGGALMAFGNRHPTSFVRLGQAREAPSAVAWGEFDRSALVRLPIQVQTADGRSTSAPTVEFRLADGSAHPHLLLAGIAQAAVAGRRTPDLADFLERTTAARVRKDPASGTLLPRNFTEVEQALSAHRAVLEAGGVFPAALVDNVIETLGRVA